MARSFRHGSGTDEATLQERFANLSEGHNKLIEAVGRHEMFLSKAVVDTLDAIGRVVRMELSNIRYYEHFKGSWWEEGEKNRAEFQQLCGLLLNQVKERAGELRVETSAEGKNT